MVKGGYREALEADSALRLDLLEGLLDNTAGTGSRDWSPLESVRSVLEDLAVVCGQKDEHVSEQYGSNDPDARQWRKLSSKLETFASRLK